MGGIETGDGDGCGAEEGRGTGDGLGAASGRDLCEHQYEGTETHDRPAVKAKTRIAVYWTESPVGWYMGMVTSSRRTSGGRWESRVTYDDKHVRWHFLDGEEGSVRWRECDSSDEEWEE